MKSAQFYSVIVITIIFSVQVFGQTRAKNSETKSILTSMDVFFLGMDGSGLDYGRMDELKNESILSSALSLKDCDAMAQFESILQNIERENNYELKKDSASIRKLMTIIKINPQMELSCYISALEYINTRPHIRRYMFDLRSYEFVFFFGRNSE